MSKIIFRKLSTTPTQSPNLYSTIKDHFYAIFTLFAIVGVSFTAGGYFVEAKQNIKIVEEMNKTLEEMNKISEEMDKISEEMNKKSEERFKNDSF